MLTKYKSHAPDGSFGKVLRIIDANQFDTIKNSMLLSNIYAGKFTNILYLQGHNKVILKRYHLFQQLQLKIIHLV